MLISETELGSVPFSFIFWKNLIELILFLPQMSGGISSKVSKAWNFLCGNIFNNFFKKSIWAIHLVECVLEKH